MWTAISCEQTGSFNHSPKTWKRTMSTLIHALHCQATGDYNRLQCDWTRLLGTQFKTPSGVKLSAVVLNFLQFLSFRRLWLVWLTDEGPCITAQLDIPLLMTVAMKGYFQQPHWPTVRKWGGGGWWKRLAGANRMMCFISICQIICSSNIE